VIFQSDDIALAETKRQVNETMNRAKRLMQTASEIKESRATANRAKQNGGQ
jgi:hypothetical protein